MRSKLFHQPKIYNTIFGLLLILSLFNFATAQETVDVGKTGLLCCRDGRQCLAVIVNTPDPFQQVRLETLHPDRQPVDTGRVKAREAFLVHGAGVGLQRDFGARFQGDPGPYLTQQALDGRC